ncbi:MAG TPA: glycosyltransferase, partial [Caulobacteraceae bacterium]|nr:glycosyltransferase [Caulobacteraceae bacterium]
ALADSMGWPVVASYHTRYETYLEHYGLQLFHGSLTRRLNRFYDTCREVFAPSQSMIEVLEAEGRRNLRLWRRGVDTERFAPERRSEAWRASLGLAPDDVAVTFVSRLVREKRLDTLAAAFARLRERGVAVRPLIVGDGPERAWLQREVPDGIFTGFLDGADLARAYASADLFLVPSDTETFGNVTLEAMASGLPTVCADATGSRSLVEPGVTGELAGALDADAMAGHIARLAADADLRARMGAAARARSLKFSWDEAMAGILERYRAIAAA